MGIISIETAEQLTLKDQQAAQLDKERADIKNAPESLKLDLIAHVRKALERGKKEKIRFQEQMIKNLNQRAGIYESSKLNDIRQMGGSEIFMKITDTKCRSLIAWVKDILFQPGATPFGLDHAPIPSLTPEAEGEARMIFMQEASSLAMSGAPLDQATLSSLMPKFKKRLEGIRKEIAQDRAEDMADKMESQLIDGGFYKALSKLIALITIFKAGFIKGPIYRTQKVRDDITDEMGRVRPGVKEEVIPEWESPSAMDIYPMPGAIGIDDGDLIEIIHYTRSEIQSMIGIDGFDEVAIREVLGRFYDKGLHEWTWDDTQRALAEGRNVDSYYDWDKIDCIELNGHIPGRMLLQYADLHVNTDEKGKIIKQELLGHEIDPDLDYLCTVWVIDRWILKIAINDNPMGRKYYYKVSFVENENAFWGDSLCETIPDPQSACNSIARAIQNNVGMASGPQTGINEKMLVPGEKPDKIWPWRVWRFVMGSFGRTEPPIQFWQPAMHVTELVAGYNHFSKIADEECGVPSWAHGDPQVGGAGNALADYERVLTPDGAIEIYRLRVGDLIVNSYGSSSKVMGVYPQGESDIFRVRFGNGTYVDCDMNHRWSVRNHHDRKFQTLTTEEILEKGLFRKTKVGRKSPKGWRPKWMLPINNHIEFEARPIKIDPYTMGALLGDGDARCRITSADKEVFERIPYPLGKQDKTLRGLAKTHAIKGIKPDYRSYGLMCKSIKKFIPDDYLFNSKEVRLELLRGMMDTDGCCSKMGEVYFATSSHKLAEDFVRLIRSLGAVTNGITIRNEAAYRDFGRGNCYCQIAYGVTFNLPGERLFYIKRKQKRLRIISKTHIYITGIEYIGKFEATCISVDSKDELFICENFILTHNTSSGLAQLMGASSRGVKEVIRNIDFKVITPVIEDLYYINFEMDEDLEYIGNVKAVAKGTSFLQAKEQMVLRLNDFLRATANPTDFQLMGPGGRRYALREIAKSMNLEADKLVPDTELSAPFQIPGQTSPSPGMRGLDNAGNLMQGAGMETFKPGAGNAPPAMGG